MSSIYHEQSALQGVWYQRARFRGLPVGGSASGPISVRLSQVRAACFPRSHRAPAVLLYLSEEKGSRENFCPNFPDIQTHICICGKGGRDFETFDAGEDTTAFFQGASTAIAHRVRPAGGTSHSGDSLRVRDALVYADRAVQRLCWMMW